MSHQIVMFHRKFSVIIDIIISFAFSLAPHEKSLEGIFEEEETKISTMLFQMSDTKLSMKLNPKNKHESIANRIARKN